MTFGLVLAGLVCGIIGHGFTGSQVVQLAGVLDLRRGEDGVLSARPK